MINSPGNTSLPHTGRLEQLQRWLIDGRRDSASLHPISADASFRRYYRLSHANKSFIVMDAPPAENKNEEFVALANKLRVAGINTPTVYEVDLQQGFLLLEDFGDVQYLETLDNENADELYYAAIVTLATMQHAVDGQELTAYDTEFLQREMRLLPEWYFAQHRGLVLTQKQMAVLESVFSLCCASALEQPQCFVHRDYHSRNLMLTPSNSPAVLDFQDAVKGPLTYDIASLLKDCYISWPDEFIYAKLEQHRQLSVANGLTQANDEQYKRWFDLIALQRHIKVVGLFCRLKLRDGKHHYMQDLPLVFRYINNTCRNYPELADFHHLLEDTGAFEEFA